LDSCRCHWLEPVFLWGYGLLRICCHVGTPDMWKGLALVVLLALPVSPAVDGLLPETREALNRAQALYGQYIHVTSAHRTPEHNRLVGGAPRSFHISGEAVDIRMPESAGQLAKLVWAMSMAGFKGFGLYQTHCHFDLRDEETFWRG